MLISEVFQLNERYEDIGQSLAKYKDHDDIYFQMSNIPKLGINPQSNYDTPLGIYAYPLKEMYQSLCNNDLPFANDRKYVIVLKTRKNIIDLYDYNESNYKKDLEKIKQKYAEKFLDLIMYDYREKFAVEQRYNTNNLEEIKNKNENLAYYDAITKILEIVPDYGIGTARKFLAHPLNVDRLLKDGKINLKTSDKLEEIINNYYKVDLQSPYLSQDIDNIFNLWAGEAHFDSPAGKFWNIIRMLSIEIGKEYGKKSSIVWNNIMRSLGYYGVSDKAGLGIIHRNEPTQAVFFSSEAIQMLEILPNVHKISLEKNESLDIDTLQHLIGIMTETNNKKEQFLLDIILNNVETLLDTGKCRGAKVADPQKFIESIPPYFGKFIYQMSFQPIVVKDEKRKKLLSLLLWYLKHKEIHNLKNDTTFIFVLFSNWTTFPMKTFFNNKTWCHIVTLPEVIDMVLRTRSKISIVQLLNDMIDVDPDNPVTLAYKKATENITERNW